MSKIKPSHFIGVLTGNFVEHYDNALFSLLSPFLAPLFFPTHDSLTALFLTLLMIPLGKLARPIGSLVFGYIGDSFGKKRTLSLSLTGSGIVCALMTFCPTYQQIGPLAPLFLILARFFQNFFAAGESMGGALYILERTCSQQKKDFYSSIYSASTVAGFLFASAALFCINSMGQVQQLWRLLYLIGSSAAFIGAYLRQTLLNDLQEEFFSSSSFSHHLKKLPRLLFSQRYYFITVLIVSGFSHANFYVAIILMNAITPLISEVSKSEMISLTTSLLFLDLLLLPLFGMLSQKLSRERLMMLSAFAAITLSIPLMLLLEGSQLPMVIALRVIFVIIGVAFAAPFHAFIQGFTPREKRFTLASLGYSFGSQLLGAPTAALSLWLFQKTNWIGSIACYWIFLALLTLVSLRAAQKNRHSLPMEVSC